jgi:xanthine/CO dehydrogenase XdhC/CoxF family maturation factor
MSARDLKHFFEARKHDEVGLVLASVYETLGSTYSKAGDRMLIASDGDFQGMLSGGCLEGDLAERAVQVAQSGECQQVTYDLRRSDEDLWGLGVGCEGLMRIFLQPLTATTGFEPFSAMIDLLTGDQVAVAATVLQTNDVETAPGSSLIIAGDELLNIGVSPSLEEPVRAAARVALGEDRSRCSMIVGDGCEAELLCAVLRPPPRVLVLGGGLDVQPVVRLMNELGWRVTVQDHRPAYIEKGDFSGAELVTCEPADELAAALDLSRFDAAVVMSHHLVTDRSYLAQLAETDLRYIGLLGPADRRDRLVDDLGESADRLVERLHGPAGLPLGGRGPASIALSIVAQMHAALVARD